ncbi:hypothetical protein A6B38_00560 [Bartonella bacilliformis]|nr:hypothetical protein AL467_00595 [Bartonella bacilliformis]KZM38182.1 hypothetical protein AWH67_00725 [Bartonella bacilliformis]KZN22195.1 hypothetical protein A6B38_00560 [Bartonella bacilliformis]
MKAVQDSKNVMLFFVARMVTTGAAASVVIVRYFLIFKMFFTVLKEVFPKKIHIYVQEIMFIL